MEGDSISWICILLSITNIWALWACMHKSHALGQIEEFAQNYYEFWDRKCEVNPAA